MLWRDLTEAEQGVVDRGGLLSKGSKRIVMPVELDYEAAAQRLMQITEDKYLPIHWRELVEEVVDAAYGVGGE